MQMPAHINILVHVHVNRDPNVHIRAVTAAAFHPNSPLVVTVSEDKFGILWNINTGLKQWQVRSI